MTPTTLGLLSIGLASDTFAVSVSSGVQFPQFKTGKAIQVALCFGFFQCLMPLLGWGIGQNFGIALGSLSNGLTGILLAFLGIKTLYEVLAQATHQNQISLDWLTLLGLAFILSLDSLSLGVGFAAIEIAIVQVVLVFGLITFALSLLGLWIGSHLGAVCQNQFKVLGGVLLLGLGGQVLLSHFPGIV